MEKISRPIYDFLIEKLTKQERLSLVETLTLLVEIRRYIEDKNLSEEYKVAKFYCDWALHSTVNRHQNSQYALNLLNIRFRDPNLPIENPQLYMQTIPDAIQYSIMGKQIGTIIVNMTKAPFIMDNYLMLSILKCLIGIPLIPKDTQEEENKRKKTDDDINNEIERFVQQCPDAILYNIMTAQESQKRIVNFMFTEVQEDEGLVRFMVEMSDGGIEEGSFQIGQK